MNKIIKCKKCGKETPESGVLFDEKSVMKALSAPLDCNGNPIYEPSDLKRSRIQNENYCYWCGAKIESEPVSKATPNHNTKPEPKSATPPSPPAPVTRKKSQLVYIVILIIIVGIIPLFFKGCGGDENSESKDIDVTDVEYVSDDDSVADNAASDDNDVATKSSASNTTFRVKDYSKEWAKIERRLKALGTPLEYVNAHSPENPETIKNNAEKEYETINKEANELYDKISNQAYDEYERITKISEAEYETVRAKAEARYNDKETDYSTYNDIRSSAYSKYSDTRSEAYSKCYDMRSAAYSKSYEIRSAAYDWYSKVRSITNGL